MRSCKRVEVDMIEGIFHLDSLFETTFHTFTHLPELIAILCLHFFDVITITEHLGVYKYFKQQSPKYICINITISHHFYSFAILDCKLFQKGTGFSEENRPPIETSKY